MEILKEKEILTFTSEEALSSYGDKDINDGEINRILSFYLFLRNNIHEISIDKERIYYSIYFWYHKFKERYFALYGSDAGIEQESYKLLEEMDNELIEGVDWVIIESIDKNNI